MDGVFSVVVKIGAELVEDLGAFFAAGFLVARVCGNNPLSFNAASNLSVSSIVFWGIGNITIPSLTNGYNCSIIVMIPSGSSGTVTQTGDVIINSAYNLSINGNGQANRTNTWKTDGYNLTVGGNLIIGAGADTGLKKLDATRNGARTSTITVGGNWLNYGTGTAPSQFIDDNSTVIFNGAAPGKQITVGGVGNPFYNLQFAGSGGEWTLQDDIMVTGQFGVTNGVFISGANTVTLQGASATYLGTDVNEANTNWTNGTLIILSDADQTLPDGETYNNIQLGRDAGTGTTTYNMGSAEYFITGTGVIDSDAKVVLTADATGINKMYDGNDSATVSFSNNSKFVDYQDLSYSYTASFDAGKNVGVGKVISVSGISLAGADAGSYTLSSTTDSTTANITARPLTVTAVTDTKVFDDTISSAGVPALTSGALQGSDTAAWTQTFDTKDIGTGKTLTPAGVVTDGNSGNNYSYTYLTDNTGVITASGPTPPTPEPETPSIPEQDLNQLNINPFSTIDNMGILHAWIMPLRRRSWHDV